MTKFKFTVEFDMEDLISISEQRSRDGSNPPPPPPPPPNGEGGGGGETGQIRPGEGGNQSLPDPTEKI